MERLPCSWGERGGSVLGMAGHRQGDLPHPGGRGGFVRGLGPCLLRALAIPVNAAIFLPYEMCMKSRIPCHDDP